MRRFFGITTLLISLNFVSFSLTTMFGLLYKYSTRKNIAANIRLYGRKTSISNSYSKGDDLLKPFYQALKYDQADIAWQFVEDLKAAGAVIPLSMYSSLSCVFSKAEHLPKALETFRNMKEMAKDEVPEPGYLALIRCYCDLGNTDKALQLLQEALKRSIEPRLRQFEPIIREICESERDPFKAVRLFHELKRRNVQPLSPQFASLLVACSQKSAFLNISFVLEINRIIEDTSKYLLGIRMSEAQRIVAAYMNVSLEEVARQGVLIESASSVGGLIVDNTTTDGTMLALNTSSDVIWEGDRDSALAMDQHERYLSDGGPTDSINFEDVLLEPVELVPELYRIMDTSNPFATSLARIVDVDKNTCLCPNCGDKLLQLRLSKDERNSTRAALGDIVTQRKNLKRLQLLRIFDTWLSGQGDYAYIVDGANIAYNRQNFQYGRFSYRQIELVVERLKARGEGRVLVILPAAYASGPCIPNRTKQGRKAQIVNQISQEDSEFIARLQEEGCLFVTPSALNDDFYWMYATLAETGKGRAMAVTNDLTRDHRLVFNELRSFVRWRSTQIVHYDFPMAAELEQSQLTANDVQLSLPGNYSREIQPGSRSWRWHLPVVDRRAWLCLNLLPMGSDAKEVPDGRVEVGDTGELDGLADFDDGYSDAKGSSNTSPFPSEMYSDGDESSGIYVHMDLKSDPNSNGSDDTEVQMAAQDSTPRML